MQAEGTCFKGDYTVINVILVCFAKSVHVLYDRDPRTLRPKSAGSFNGIWINSFLQDTFNPVIALILGFCRLNLFGMQTDVLTTCQRETLQPTMQYFTSSNLSVFNTLHIGNPKSSINAQEELPFTITDQSWQEKHKHSFR